MPDMSVKEAVPLVNALGCIARWSNAPPLHANADCVSGVVTVEGLRTVPHADCASGGIRAIETFKTLCPKYSKEIERKDFYKENVNCETRLHAAMRDVS